MHARAVAGVVGKRLADHRRAEGRAADADVHHVGDAFSAMAPPLTAAHLQAEGAHACSYRMHIGGDVGTSGLPARARRAAQRHMKHGAGLGGVDAFAVEHRADATGDAGLLGQAQQQRELVFVEQVLRVIQGHAAGADLHARGARGIGGEAIAKGGQGMEAALLERLPGSEGGRGRHWRGPGRPRRGRGTRAEDLT